MKEIHIAEMSIDSIMDLKIEKKDKEWIAAST